MITRIFGFVILSLLACNTTTLACLNEKRVLLNGKHFVSNDDDFVPYGHHHSGDISYYEEELREMDSLWRTNKDFDAYSDYGVLLAYLGRYVEAKAVFQEIEKKVPGLYSTAANLGTVYELLGDNEAALKWISKALEIDPTSHENSEWLHVKILEVKIKGEAFLTSEFLLGTDFGTDVIPTSKRDSLELIRLRNSIYYQLNERVSFVKPKDKIVALLLFELGNICAITADVTSALRVYDRAIEYGYSSEVLNSRYAKFKGMQAGLDNEYTESTEGERLNNPHQESGKSKMFIGLILAGCVGLLILYGTIRHYRR